jgi:glutamine amidotransferase-like uncharacterized protein
MQSAPFHKKTIAIFLHHPTCSVDSVNGIIKSLSPFYTIKIWTQHKVSDGFFDTVDLVVFPGGDGDASQFKRVMKNNLDEVKRFMSRGGRFLGICMGAYWADSYYFDLLKGTRVVQYIKRQKADVRSSYGTTVPINWRGKPHRMYFYDGPTFIGGDYEVVATYSNGDPMAIVQGSIGLIGCHLESESNWYTKKYMQPHWHGGEHHIHLCAFVSDFLINNRQLTLF